MAGTTTSGNVRPSSQGERRAGGRYVLGDLLGRGGMAEVFAGHSIGDHGFQKPVAIKRLLPELANDEVFVERLIGEAKLLVGMQHGNVVSVLDLARDGDDVFLVMEFVDGPSLRQLLKSRGTRGLPLGIATYVVQAAAAGLEFAHSRPGGAIIHADISPSNILLTTSGEVRVADFGIARREGGGHGVVEGKWAYMAPEQARGEPLTPRSDVFALGVVLYELICGAHPFGRQVTHEERDSQPMRVIPPRVVRPSIPPGIDAICMRALAHDPRERYARMQQLIDAIVEERFSNQWREGAADLTRAIRECSPVGASPLMQPRTMVTDRPVTIATRSLLEKTPVRPSSVRGSRSSYSQSSSLAQGSSEVHSRLARGSSSPISQSQSIPEVDDVFPIPDSNARTNAILADDIIRAAAMMDLPPLLRADGTPMPPFKLSEALVPGQDLASVIGGHTISQHVASVAVEGRGAARWTIGVLIVAAVIGAIAAFAIARDGGDSSFDAPPVRKAPVYSPVLELVKTDEPKPARKAGEPIKWVEKKKDSPANEPADKIEPKIEPKVEDKVEAKVDDKIEPKIEDKIEDKAKVDDKSADKPADEKKPAVPVRHAQARTPVAAPAKKVEPGILRVNSEPWSYVFVNGQRTSTPAKISLPPGTYTVRFVNDEAGRTVNKTVKIESGKTSKLSINLEDEI